MDAGAANDRLQPPPMPYRAGDLQRDIAHLLVREPFFAHVLQSMGRDISTHIQTAAVGWTGELYLLLVNASYFSGLSLEQRCAVLKHEVLHIVFRHLTRGRGLIPDLFNIAADLVVNQLCADLPGGALNIDDFIRNGFPLKPDRTAEEYYALLASKTDDAHWATKLWESKSAVRGQHECWKNLFGNDLQPSETGGDTPQPGGILSAEKKHAPWTPADWKAADWKAGELCLQAAEAVRRKDPTAWGVLPAGIRRELAQLALERAPRISWKQTLRIFAAGSSRSRLGQTMKRASKRFGTHPGARIRRQRRLLVAIDTSGSTSEFLELFYAELRNIWKSGVQIHVVECDSAVAASYAFHGKPPSVFHGGGGTCFDPVFDWMRSAEGRQSGPFDGSIYFTDGYAAQPRRPPLCRLLWVLPPQISHAPTSVLKLGTVLKMKD